MNALTLILSVVLGGILGNSVDANYNGRHACPTKWIPQL